jgi:hypothetical protein
MKSLFLSLTIFIYLSQLSASIAYSQNYIFEFPYTEGGGSSLEKQEPEYLTTYFAFTNDSADIDISASIYRDLHLTEDDVGKTFIIYSYDNYPGFVTFVDNLTNGIDNRFQKAYTFCELGGGATVGSESNFFGHLTQNGIDFEGYRINSIALYIDSLTIDFNEKNWGGADQSGYDYTVSSKFIFDVTLIDSDLDGVPDDQEVNEYSDLDGDGVDDSKQEDIRCLYTSDGECEICIKIPPEISSFGLIRMIEPEIIGNNNQKPDDFPFGLLSFRMEVEKGATVTMPIYFSQELPIGSKWYKYDPEIGWLDCSDFAVFPSDRKSVLLTLTDGGSGDIDGRANSIIIDPSGPAVSNNSNGYNSGGGCFIVQLMDH